MRRVVSMGGPQNRMFFLADGLLTLPGACDPLRED